MLRWTAVMAFNCTPSETEGGRPRYADPYDSGGFTEEYGAVLFTIDEETGKLPQIDDEEAPCPKTVWTAVVVGDASNSFEGAPEIRPARCPYLSPDDPHPDGNPCAARPTKQLAQNVTDYILSQVQCVGMTTWPDTNYTIACWDDNWGESGSPRIGGLLTPGALTLGCIVIASIGCL